MQHSAPRLEVAANNACTVTAQLVLAALEVSQDSGTGDSVQVDLEERSEVRQGEGRVPSEWRGVEGKDRIGGADGPCEGEWREEWDVRRSRGGGRGSGKRM